MYTYYPNQKQLIRCRALGGCCYPLFMIIDNFLNIHNLCVRDTGNLHLFVCFLYWHKTWLAFYRDQAVLNCYSHQHPLSFTSEPEWLMWLLQTIRPVAQSLVAHYCSLHISIHTYTHVCMYCTYEHTCPHMNGYSLSYVFMHPQLYVCAQACIWIRSIIWDIDLPVYYYMSYACIFTLNSCIV